MPVTPAGAAAFVGVGATLLVGVGVAATVLSVLDAVEFELLFVEFEVFDEDEVVAEFEEFVLFLVVALLCLVVEFLVVVVALLVAALLGVVVTAAVFELLFEFVFVLLFELFETEVSAEAPDSVEIPVDPNCGGVIESTAPRPPTVPPAINNARFMPFPSFVPR